LQIEREVREFISKELARELDSIRDDESLLEAGVIDSVGVLSLVSFIEHRYKLR
jgi:acyl carrier protein